MTEQLWSCEWCRTVRYMASRPRSCPTCQTDRSFDPVSPTADKPTVSDVPTDLELASATAACMMPALNRLWDNAKCDPTMGLLIGSVRKVAKLLASATPDTTQAIPPKCNQCGKPESAICGACFSKAHNTYLPAIPSREAVARAIEEAEPEKGPSLEPRDWYLAQADAVLALLRPVELDEDELARRIDRIQCISADGPVTLDTPAIARVAIAYFNEQMGPGQREQAPSAREPESSDAPPALDLHGLPPFPWKLHVVKGYSCGPISNSDGYVLDDANGLTIFHLPTAGQTEGRHQTASDYILRACNAMAAQTTPPAACQTCHGTGFVHGPCPDGKPGCCVVHPVPCPHCKPPATSPACSLCGKRQESGGIWLSIWGGKLQFCQHCIPAVHSITASPVAHPLDDGPKPPAPAIRQPHDPGCERVYEACSPDENPFSESIAARRAALVAACKAKCGRCRKEEKWDDDNPNWAQQGFGCLANDIRRQIEALDNEAARERR